MNPSWHLILSLSLAAAGQAQADPPAAIEAAVKQLGDADYETRERATELLIRAGQAAKSATEAAARSNDPEVALRARLILKRLASGIDPEVSPAMAALIEEFNETEASRRFTLIQRLAQPDEFRTLWKVIAKVADAGQRRSQESSLRSRLVTMVSENHRAGKHD